MPASHYRSQCGCDSGYLDARPDRPRHGQHGPELSFDNAPLNRAKIIVVLNSGDKFTPASLSRLKDVIHRKRPIVFWIGAGTSRWADLPSWRDSARRMHKTFAKSVADFPGSIAKAFIDREDYPEFFQLCKDTDATQYYRCLVEQFGIAKPGLVYAQLIENLRRISPLQIVTTNIDLCLEQNLGPIEVVDRADLERCSESIVAGAPFIAKLHGSISSVKTAVFAKGDYEEIILNKSYIAALHALFDSSSVVFLSYGLRDKYVLDLIAESSGHHAVFGAGPHFRLTTSPGPPKDGVYLIGYSAAHHQDHRAALTILSVIEQRRKPLIEEPPLGATYQEAAKQESTFYISSFNPSGTRISGQALELARPGGEDKINALVGLGFAQGELPSSATVAFHDIAVGLVCFDRVLLPLDSLGTLHERATSDVFWALSDSDALRFVDVVHNPFYVARPGSAIGDLGIARLQDPGQKETRSSMSVVRGMLRPAPNMERQAEPLIEGLESKILLFNASERLNLPQMVRDRLLMPRVTQLLGYSDYITTDRIPRWLAYPTLRFAHLVQTGLICGELGVRAARTPFGGLSLLSAAFNVRQAEETVYEYASFVMAGAFGSNLSGHFEKNPQLLLDLVRFRESPEGQALRREISDRLETNDGVEFSAAIEGGLSRVVSATVLQSARNKFSSLMKAAAGGPLMEAVWSDASAGDPSLRLWRDRSRELLFEEAKSRGIGSDSPCLCGSGDPLKDCCMRALR